MIFLLDDATSNIDANLEKKIYQLLKNKGLGIYFS